MFREEFLLNGQTKCLQDDHTGEASTWECLGLGTGKGALPR